MVEQNISAPAAAHDAQAASPEHQIGHALGDNGPGPLVKQYLEEMGRAPGDQPMGIVHRKYLAPEGVPSEGEFGERIKHWDPKPEPVTAERVEKVRAEMEKSVNELIPADEKATLKQFRDGALDANPQAIQAAYESLKDNPPLLHAMVKELNSEFKQEGSQVSFSVTDDNRLLLSADAHNGVEFGGKGPEAKAVTRGDDGYIHLSQEQYKSASTDDVMKDVRQKASEDSFYLELTTPYKPNLSETIPFLHTHEPAHLRPGEVWDRAIVKDPNDYSGLIQQQAEDRSAVIKNLDQTLHGK